MDYKIIKSENGFLKGDCYTETPSGMFECCTVSVSDHVKTKTTHAVSKVVMEKAVKDGIAIAMSKTVYGATNQDWVTQSINDKFDRVLMSSYTKELIRDNKVLTKTIKDLDRKLELMINRYNVDIKVANHNCRIGKIKECEKVEAVTVLNNLIEFAENIKKDLK